MDHKETWQGRWYKKEVTVEGRVLTISDHWYFQTSLWRVAPIRNVVNWYMDQPWQSKWFHEHCESKINQAFNGDVERIPEYICPKPHGDPRDQFVRATCQRTFIWGPVGEDRYIVHLGGKPEDWALDYPREELDTRLAEKNNK
jgi:hypothetical protein